MAALDAGWIRNLSADSDRTERTKHGPRRRLRPVPGCSGCDGDSPHSISSRGLEDVAHRPYAAHSTLDPCEATRDGSCLQVGPGEQNRWNNDAVPPLPDADQFTCNLGDDPLAVAPFCRLGDRHEYHLHLCL